MSEVNRLIQEHPEHQDIRDLECERRPDQVEEEPVIPQMNPPVATIDRDWVRNIIDNHRDAIDPSVVADTDGLAQSLINYVTLVRRGEVPVDAQ